MALPFAEQRAFPVCVLPGCRGIAVEQGEPCEDCVEAFGPMLVRAAEAGRLTAAVVAERDAGTLAAIRRQVATRVAAESVRERKANQTCWCCDERHTCTRNDRGLWECDGCADSTGAEAAR